MLCSGIQDTVSSLHNLQLATLNVNGGKKLPLSREVFTQLRLTISSQWECIIELLHQCFNFCDKAAYLHDTRCAYADEELAEYVREFLAMSGPLLSSSRLVLSLHEGIVAEVTRCSPYFTSFLQHSGTGIRHRPASVCNAYAEHCSKPRDTPELTTDSFMQSNLLAAYPDGLAALASVADALQTTFTSLSMISQVWATVYEKYQGSAAISGPQFSLSEWAVIKELILSSICHSGKMKDAIIIEPVAPRCRNRRSSRDSDSLSSINGGGQCLLFLRDA
ncbi:hypothetical protein H0H81_000783 [Sphagnurus paluster]|uniref:Uncharacterized protein n=1 Tax=Sphagnurus paluster TaxID=117069 RepID=A0A9P7KI33_9AGAR|nr:hypothetical protein H0H81_000783 [Sphagnurus paluster]